MRVHEMFDHLRVLRVPEFVWTLFVFCTLCFVLGAWSRRALRRSTNYKYQAQSTKYKRLLTTLNKLLRLVQPTFARSIFVSRRSLNCLNASLHQTRRFTFIAEPRVRATH